MMDYVQLPTAQKVLVAGHKHPDGDSLACCVALCNYYKSNFGAEVKTWVSGEIPKHIQWMTDLVEIEPAPYSFKPEIIIVVDTPATSENVGLDLEKFCTAGTKLIAIDHHKDKRARKPIYLSRKNIPRLNQTLAETDFVEIVQSHKVSTASILIHYFYIYDPILYVGLRTDSGNFARDTLECMRLITRLSITDEQINKYHGKMRSAPKNPTILEHLKNNGIKHISGEKSDFHLIGIEEDSKEVAKGLLAVLRMFYPNVGVVWRSGMSLRAEDFDVSSVAVSLGGGGHSAAAGSYRVKLDDMPLIQETIGNYLRTVPGVLAG